MYVHCKVDFLDDLLSQRLYGICNIEGSIIETIYEKRVPFSIFIFSNMITMSISKK